MSKSVPRCTGPEMSRILTGLRVCSMCNLNVVEGEYHFILQCEKYIDVRRRYLKKYYRQMPSCFELIQLLSTQY